MKTILYTLALFIFIKGPELYSNHIKREVKREIVAQYSNPLKELGILFPDVVAAQIALETAYLTSTIYKENNNLFGMKESSRKWDMGTRHGHAYYAYPIHSLLDYRDWQAQMLSRYKNPLPQTNEEYIYFLQHLPGGRRYAEDPKYADKLRKIISL